MGSKTPNIDFETYSEAGYRFDDSRGHWVSSTTGIAGLPSIGAAAYSEHLSTEAVSLAYDMHDGRGVQLWTPGAPAPSVLLDHVAGGGLVRAANTRFEFLIWNNVCVRLWGWPRLTIEQLRDPLAQARAYALPGSLQKAIDAVGAEVSKIDDGKRLIKKFSCPRNPTKTDSRRRLLASEDIVDGLKFYEYNMQDVQAEDALSDKLPPLDEGELAVWLLDQRINDRGIAIDTKALASCVTIVDQELEKGNRMIQEITGGAVRSVSEVQKILAWLAGKGVRMGTLDKKIVAYTLDRDDLDPDVRAVLTLRKMLGAASVKKVYSIRDRLSADGRLRDMFMYHGAATGRWAGRGPQPQNLPNSGPEWSGGEWSAEAADKFLTMAVDAPWEMSATWGDLVPCVSGSLRGLFVAAEGHDLICSDYSAIEAVVLAALAGERWRMDVFNTHGKIYEMSASKITGVPFAEFERVKRETGDHHPLRKKIGKVAELASGYQGGLGAWKAFGADKHLTEDEIRDAIKAWRNESPMIVRFWREVESATLRAVKAPGSVHMYRGIIFRVEDNVLRIRLLSGRCLSYHRPTVEPKTMPWGEEREALFFWGVDSLTKQWVKQDTYGGKLTENIVQGVAADLLRFAMLNLEAAGYPVVMHVHDEIISEVPQGSGSVEEFENIMAATPQWAAGWPVRAAGGWRGKRYRKD